VSERVMLSARVPEELKDLVDADKRDNQEIVRAALWREFGGERLGDIERRIEEKENRIKMYTEEIEDRESELNEEKRELQALKQKRQKEKQQSKEDVQESLEALETVSWDVENPAIQTHADELDMKPKALIAELEDYYD